MREFLYQADVMGIVFSQITGTLGAFIDPVFWLVVLGYLTLFSVVPRFRMDGFPHALVHMFIGALMFGAYFYRKCGFEYKKKREKDKELPEKFHVSIRHFLQGTVAVIIHQVSFLIMCFLPVLRNIGMIPNVGRAVLGLFSMWPAWFWTSLLFVC